MSTEYGGGRVLAMPGCDLSTRCSLSQAVRTPSSQERCESGNFCTARCQNQARRSSFDGYNVLMDHRRPTCASYARTQPEGRNQRRQSTRLLCSGIPWEMLPQDMGCAYFKDLALQVSLRKARTPRYNLCHPFHGCHTLSILVAKYRGRDHLSSARAHFLRQQRGWHR